MNVNRIASYLFWAFLAFIILSALFAPELWNESFPGEWRESAEERQRGG